MGGRYVSHFWRLLTNLGIPHATLLDFDLGRAPGGANMIRTVFAALESVDRDLTLNPLVVDGTIDLTDLEGLTDEDVLKDWKNNDLLQALRHEAVYFSDPIGLDFAMLVAFPAAYA
ncbi:hypothetical protein E2974_15585 [Paracoccus yeei]